MLVNISNKPLRRSFWWTFVVADVAHPILGLDFLAANEILVDCHRCQLIDQQTNLKATCTHKEQIGSSIYLAVPDPHPKITEMLHQYENLLKPLQVSEVAPGNYCHTIDTGNTPPIFARPRQLAPDKLSAAQAEFNKMMAMGIIRPSNSDWCSPLHMVKKPDGSWRPCGDYRALNAVTIPDRYPIPNIQMITQKLSGSTIFSKIHLVKAYLQIPMSENDIKKTSITTPFGLFEYVGMPFDLRNAS